MSFIYDLHRPRFTRRLDLTPRGTTVALAPTRDEAGYRAPPAKKSAKERLQRLYAGKRRARPAARAPREAESNDVRGWKAWRHTPPAFRPCSCALQLSFVSIPR